jgi:hypothetical protein
MSFIEANTKPLLFARARAGVALWPLQLDDLFYRFFLAERVPQRAAQKS